MTEHKQWLMKLWRRELNSDDKDQAWREVLTTEDLQFVERLDEMNRDFWEETNDPESEEWREDLTPEEAEIVAEWDGDFLEGYTRLWQDVAEAAKRAELARSSCDETPGAKDD